MKKLRNLLIMLLGVNMVFAMVADWAVPCKVAIVLNALALLGCNILEMKNRL